MKKSRLLGAVCACVFSFVSMSSHAALLGRLPTTPGGTDWQAYYDDDADLTWLQDANMAGTMQWSTANAWANSMAINEITGWRLPKTFDETPCGNGSSLTYHCMNGELENMFYNVLGGIAGSSITTIHNANYDLFSNIQSLEYWSSTLDNINSSTYAWIFYFLDGGQVYYHKSHNIYAWAVHDGDVGAAVVPLPAAAWLFGSGLLGLIGMARRKSHL